MADWKILWYSAHQKKVIRSWRAVVQKLFGVFNTVARDVPGGKRILIIKINAQHNALSKAIKTRFKIESIYYATFRLNLRHLQKVDNIAYKIWIYIYANSVTFVIYKV